MLLAFLLLSCGGGGGESSKPTTDEICVAMGDSITAGVLVNKGEGYVPKLQNLLGMNVINEGVPGAESWEGADKIEIVLSIYNPRYLTIYYGTNDIDGSDNVDFIIDNLREIVQKAKKNGTIPIIATLGPFVGNWAWRKPYAIELNIRIRQLAIEEKIKCTDLEIAMNWNPDLMVMPDGEHPNAAGHSVIANTFYQTIINQITY
jgi:lysophospholipase L1-like esterase